MALVQVKVPDIGDFKDVAIIEVLVQVGDTIRPEQSLITVESDKASMEIPSSHGGVVKSLKVKLGDTVNIGDLLLELESAGAPAAAPAPTASAAPAASAAAAPTPVAAPAAAPAAPDGRPVRPPGPGTATVAPGSRGRPPRPGSRSGPSSGR